MSLKVLSLPIARALAASAVILAAISPAHSQSGDGFTVQERPGLALVKPQAWSNPADATVYEFKAYTDRTVANAQGAGYYEFQTRAGNKRQIAASQVVKLLVYPTESTFPQMQTDDDRKQVAALDTELQAVIAAYPSTSSYLKPSVKLLEAELAQYDAGNLRIDGAWKPKEEYLAGQIGSLRTQLQADIRQAKPPSSFDLANDPRFVSLQQLARSSPSANTLVTELTATQGKLIRGEKRDALLLQLHAPSISFPEAMGAVARLQALQAEEDPRSDAFVKKWKEDLAKLTSIKTAAVPLAGAMEKELSAVKSVSADTPPALSPELSSKIEPLSDEMRLFVASLPAPALVGEAQQPLAIYKISEAFKKLGPIGKDHQYLEGKDVIDPLMPLAPAVGPETVRVVTGLQAAAATKIDAFTKTREEANLLAASGKPAEALQKYEAAYAMIPDPQVSDLIAGIKKTLPPPSPSPAHK